MTKKPNKARNRYWGFQSKSRAHNLSRVLQKGNKYPKGFYKDCPDSC